MDHVRVRAQIAGCDSTAWAHWIFRGLTGDISYLGPGRSYSLLEWLIFTVVVELGR